MRRSDERKGQAIFRCIEDIVGLRGEEYKDAIGFVNGSETVLI